MFQLTTNTFKINSFYIQEAEDNGGPRKEFFRLMLTKIKEEYFDPGMNIVNATQYEIIGLVMGMWIILIFIYVAIKFVIKIKISIFKTTQFFCFMLLQFLDAQVFSF